MIAVLAHTHPSITSGGAEISAYTLYLGLLERGVAACFVAMVPESAIDRVRLDTPGEHVLGYEPGDYEAFYHLADPSVPPAVESLLARLGADTVVFHHFLNFGVNTVRAVARRRPGRVLLVLHEFLAICNHHGQMVTRPALRLCAASSPGACGTCFQERDAVQFDARREHFLDAFAQLAGFVSPSEFLKERFVAWGLPAASIAVIENGVPRLPPPEEPRRAPLAPAAAGDEDEVPGIDADDVAVTIGFFGQINPFKGVDLLLDAADLIGRRKKLSARVRLRVHGHVVGVSDAFAQRFHDAVAEHPFLDYLGPYQNERVFELMRACDFVLMASKWWENSPVVIQEAYACGRPLLVPGIGGMKEKIIDGVTGLHFQAADASDLARVIERAATPGLAQRLRRHLPAVGTGLAMAGAYLAWLAQCAQSPTAHSPAGDAILPRLMPRLRIVEAEPAPSDDRDPHPSAPPSHAAPPVTAPPGAHP